MQRDQSGRLRNGESQARDGIAGELLELFQDCKLVMRWDVQTCLFLMPYIIHSSLDAGQDTARDQAIVVSCDMLQLHTQAKWPPM